MQRLALENASTAYSLTGQLEYNVLNEDDKHWLYQCLLHNTVKDAVLHHEHNIKIIKLNKSSQMKKITLEMILMKDYILI